MRKVKFTVEFTADLDDVQGQFHTADDWYIMAMREVLRQTHYNTDATLVTSEIVEE